MLMNEFEARKKKIVRIGLGLALLVVFGVLAPFFFLALKGAVAAAATLVVGGLTIGLAPLVSQKFANWRLKMIKAEARANPIETLQIAYMNRMNAWRAKEEAINVYAAAVTQYINKAKQFVQKYPHKMPEYKEKAEGMQKLLHLRRAKLRAAAEVLDRERDLIEEKKHEYQMALELARVNAAGKDIDENAVLEEMKIGEAMNEIDRASAIAFAELDNITAQMEYDHDRAKNLQTMQIPNANIIDVEIRS